MFIINLYCSDSLFYSCRCSLERTRDVPRSPFCWIEINYCGASIADMNYTSKNCQLCSNILADVIILIILNWNPQKTGIYNFITQVFFLTDPLLNVTFKPSINVVIAHVITDGTCLVLSSSLVLLLPSLASFSCFLYFPLVFSSPFFVSVSASIHLSSVFCIPLFFSSFLYLSI